MRISKQPVKVVKLLIDGYQIEQVSSFCYLGLGSMITEDGRSEKEIKRGIGMAKSKFYEILKIFTGQLSTTTKKQMIKSLVWNVALYATEAWTMRKVGTQRLEAFEMWVLEKNVQDQLQRTCHQQRSTFKGKRNALHHCQNN